MKIRLLLAAASAFALSGCITTDGYYDGYGGGGYYNGGGTIQYGYGNGYYDGGYYDGGYYGGDDGYYRYGGYGYPYGYGGYGGYYSYPGPYRPHYGHQYPRPGHDAHPPRPHPPNGHPGDGRPPWRNLGGFNPPNAQSERPPVMSRPMPAERRQPASGMERYNGGPRPAMPAPPMRSGGVSPPPPPRPSALPPMSSEPGPLPGGNGRPGRKKIEGRHD